MKGAWSAFKNEQKIEKLLKSKSQPIISLCEADFVVKLNILCDLQNHITEKPANETILPTCIVGVVELLR